MPLLFTASPMDFLFIMYDQMYVDSCWGQCWIATLNMYVDSCQGQCWIKTLNMFHYVVLRFFTMICLVFHAFFIYFFATISYRAYIYWHVSFLKCDVLSAHLCCPPACWNMQQLVSTFLCVIMNCVPQFSDLILICCFLSFLRRN